MTTTRLLAFVIVIVVARCCRADGAEKKEMDEFVARVRAVLPKGWECSATAGKGKMGHPHGLDEPVFRVDFRNPHASFSFAAAPGKAERRCPSLRFHFHRIADRPKIMATIEAESLYTWDIPIHFAETADYLVATSPGWINGGVYTDEAQRLAAPLHKALKKFFRQGKAAEQG